MKINRLLTNICSNELEESKNFFCSLFNFTVEYDSDWFVHLVSQENALEIGILAHEHELLPNKWQGNAQGFYLTFVVDDAVSVCNKAKVLGYEIVQEPSATEYGQLRALVREPAGCLIDISSISLN